MDKYRTTFTDIFNLSEHNLFGNKEKYVINLYLLYYFTVLKPIVLCTGHFLTLQPDDWNSFISFQNVQI